MADVFAAVKPLLTASKFIGLAPFRIDSKGKTLVVFGPGLACSALAAVLFGANAAYLTHAKLTSGNKTIDSYTGLAPDVILLACGIAPTLCCILLPAVQRNKYVRVVRGFHEVGSEVTRLGEEIPYESVLRRSRRYLLLLFLLLLLLFLHTVFYLENTSTPFYVSYVYAWFSPKIYNFLMEFQFVSGVLLLGIHFNTLNKSLEKIKDSRKPPVGAAAGEEISNLFHRQISTIGHPMENWKNRSTDGIDPFALFDGKMCPKIRTRKLFAARKIHIFGDPDPGKDLEKIKTIRKIHGNLCEIKEYLNYSFSLQLLTSIAQSFIFITANLYMIFTTVSKSEAFSVFAISHPILWFAMHTIELVIIVLSCTNTSKAANYTAVLVHKLLAKESRLELRNQLLHRKVSFTASGFFNLDMTLLQSIIGAATTYLVILIQFHNSYEVPRE